MYCDYFGFSERPFHLTPNPRFLFLSKSHKEAFAHLLYGIDQQVGFICLTGEVGTGKTTVLRTLLEQLGDDPYRLALIFNPKLSAIELMQAICSEFGVQSEKRDLVSLYEAFNAFLLQERKDGKTVVLIVDEAQNLAPEVLEQIRLLSNLETETDKLLQIVLVGQPELTEVLARTELRQLKQRIAVNCDLTPLDRADSAEYIKHRLHVAGWQGGVLFDSKALAKIYRLSGGLPRKINLFADRALLVAYGDESRQIDVKRVAQAAAELGVQSRKGSPLLLAMSAALVAVVLIFGGFVTSSFRSEPETQVYEPFASVVARGVTPAASDDTQLYRSLVERWQGPADVDQTFDVDSIKALGYEIATPLTKSWEWLLRVGYPSLVAFTDPLTGQEVRIVLLGRSGDRFEIALADGSLHRVSSIDLMMSRIISINILWKNRAGLPLYVSERTPPVQIETFQALLGQALGKAPHATAQYDDETVRRVQELQRRGGIGVDGQVGPQTLMLLYGMTDSTVPKLEARP